MTYRVAGLLIFKGADHSSPVSWTQNLHNLLYQPMAV